MITSQSSISHCLCLLPLHCVGLYAAIQSYEYVLISFSLSDTLSHLRSRKPGKHNSISYCKLLSILSCMHWSRLFSISLLRIYRQKASTVLLRVYREKQVILLTRSCRQILQGRSYSILWHTVSETDFDHTLKVIIENCVRKTCFYLQNSHSETISIIA